MFDRYQPEAENPYMRQVGTAMYTLVTDYQETGHSVLLMPASDELPPELTGVSVQFMAVKGSTTRYILIRHVALIAVEEIMRIVAVIRQCRMAGLIIDLALVDDKGQHTLIPNPDVSTHPE